jgi:short subunit dehydrogenase-like uncharacterized protein
MKRVVSCWNRDLDRAAASMGSVVAPAMQTIIGVVFAVQVWSTTWPVTVRMALSMFFVLSAVTTGSVALLMKRRSEPRLP